MTKKLVPAVAALVLLAGCEARFGNDAGPVDANATAEGRAEEGRLTVEAPGFNLSINIPEGLRSHANFEEDSGLIYPGASFSGMHVQGQPEGGSRQDQVELRFTTGDPVDRVVAWYRDPARGQEVQIASAEQRGGAFVIAGTGKDGQPFTLNIAPREGGGSDARLVLSDRH